jgi:hypothetical protein
MLYSGAVIEPDRAFRVELEAPTSVERKDPPVNPFALAAGLVTFVVLLTVVAMRWRRARGTDLGEVSSQWVIEHRMGPAHDRWNQR